MAQVFISYNNNSTDYLYAKQMYDVLNANHIKAWFAPVSIAPGQDFALEIGTEIAGAADDIEERSRQLGKSKVLLLILSKGSMESAWVKREVKLAINKKMFVFAVHVDHEPLTYDFEYLLVDVQIIEGYHLHKAAQTEALSRIKEHVGTERTIFREEKRRFSESELHVHRIAGGDPYYEEGNTLSVECSGHEFYLAPPEAQHLASDQELQSWCEENGFVSEDVIFGTDLESLIREIHIPDLRDRIETSRRKIFEQFRNRENGCYFNNKKYGVEDINPFGRTRDERELPQLRIRMFVTDYFTHRVMKDVCKTLFAEGNKYLKEIDFTAIGANKIFFTSLGINLLLLEDSLREDYSVLITSRSTNAAETYQQRKISLSVIEGVSISDYDTYQRKVRLTLAVERGLIEELNVKEDLIQLNTLRFYDLFVNQANLEMGISCTIELKKEYGITENVLELHGKDEELEIADKRKVLVSELEAFIRNNQTAILPQAMYVLCAFLENRGVLMLERFRREMLRKESFICAKNGTGGPCGDKIADGKHFVAVIDGATPKGERLWNGKKGDVFISELLGDAIERLDPAIDAQSAIEQLNAVVRKQYEERGINFASLESEEQLQASVLIYSAARKEIWSFGDCMLRINQKSYHNIKKGDIMLADLRAFCMEAAELENRDVRHSGSDYGRAQILPFLKQFTLFANTGKSFGYDVINGGEIFKERVKVYAVQPGDHIVMASDGYPRLFDTLEETEKYLQDALRDDPDCTGRLRGTKGICSGAVSYDDRCFVSFVVEK